ncbi:diacylglycerol/lipid kinase family protein [Aquihabitans sp. McL0605]|uniref:diacylglycerol/lipid kinase family protein n=1 Tax=Aquihabitans sp. McL0605 TaxID=3415671 RepID=UPI003CECBFA2
MTTTSTTESTSERLELRRRLAAIGALALGATALVAGTIGLAGDVARVFVVPLLLLVAIAAAWMAATRKGPVRMMAAIAVALALVLVLVLVVTASGQGLVLLLLAAVVAASTALTRYALRRDPAQLKALDTPGDPVGPARHAVLIMNLKSGGGKAERFSLVDECRARGIEPVVLQPGDDMVVLAQEAIDRGADVIGMAGGDGSQALVASVAMAADVALVCIPAGTRNHFALDLGLDRDDVVGALDAFGDAVERRIDLAEVNGRVFVNNVSLGVYAKVVQAPEYRDAKGQTTAAMLPELLGPEAPPFDLHFTGPDGEQRDGAQIIQVSNNPYVLTSMAGFGSRARLDTGQLGIAAAEVRGGADVAAFVAAESAGRLARFPGWSEWSAPTFTVASGSPVEAGVDGEALLLDPPLAFRLLPGAVRIRLPHHAPGYSPAALLPPSRWWTLRALLRAAVGRATPIEESLR